jgi:hypothetical protein
MLPKATAFVMALKITALVRRLQQAGMSGMPRHDVVDFERHSDAEQQRTRDDIREIEFTCF